jgi:hypothetical protein
MDLKEVLLSAILLVGVMGVYMLFSAVMVANGGGGP